jgi:hypothetical protein
VIFPWKSKLFLFFILSAGIAGVIYFHSRDEENGISGKKYFKIKNEKKLAPENDFSPAKSSSEKNLQNPEFYKSSDRIKKQDGHSEKNVSTGMESYSFINSTPVRKIFERYSMVNNTDNAFSSTEKRSASASQSETGKSKSNDDKDAKGYVSSEIIDRDIEEIPYYPDGIDETGSYDGEIAGDVPSNKSDSNDDVLQNTDVNSFESISDIFIESFETSYDAFFSELLDTASNPDFQEISEISDASETEENKEKIVFLVNHLEIKYPGFCWPGTKQTVASGSICEDASSFVNAILDGYFSNPPPEFPYIIAELSDNPSEPGFLQVVLGEGYCPKENNEVIGCNLNPASISESFYHVRYNADFMSPFCSNNPLIVPPCYVSEQKDINLSSEFLGNLMTIIISDGYFTGSFLSQSNQFLDDWKDFEFIDGYLFGWVIFDEPTLNAVITPPSTDFHLSLTDILPGTKDKVEGQSAWFFVIYVTAMQVPLIE